MLDVRHDVSKVERGEVLFSGVSAEPRDHISEQVEGRKVFEATMAGHVARLEILDRVPRPGLQRWEEDAEAHLILHHGVPTVFYDRIVAAVALAQHPLQVSTRRLVADKDGQVYVAKALFPAPLPRACADSVVFLRRRTSPRHLSCMRVPRWQRTHYQGNCGRTMTWSSSCLPASLAKSWSHMRTPAPTFFCPQPSPTSSTLAVRP